MGMDLYGFLVYGIWIHVWVLGSQPNLQVFEFGFGKTLLNLYVWFWFGYNSLGRCFSEESTSFLLFLVGFLEKWRNS